MTPPRPPTPLALRVGSLLARFDGTVMRAEAARAIGPATVPLSAAHQAIWTRLLAWCFAGAGAGDGRSPFWRPWEVPRVEQRFTVATLAAGPDAERAQLVAAFCRHLDGSDQLAAAGGAWAGLLLRLRVKCHDALWWRARQPSDPWDGGYLIGEPHALQRFRPRRATLMVAHGLGDEALREALHILRTHSAGFHHPVRLLVVGRSSEALAWSSTPSSSAVITEMAWPPDAGPGAAASTSNANASR
jgi:hypothetical protein